MPGLTSYTTLKGYDLRVSIKATGVVYPMPDKPLSHHHHCEAFLYSGSSAVYLFETVSQVAQGSLIFTM